MFQDGEAVSELIRADETLIWLRQLSECCRRTHVFGKDVVRKNNSVASIFGLLLWRSKLLRHTLWSIHDRVRCTFQRRSDALDVQRLCELTMILTKVLNFHSAAQWRSNTKELVRQCGKPICSDLKVNTRSHEATAATMVSFRLTQISQPSCRLLLPH